MPLNPGRVASKAHSNANIALTRTLRLPINAFSGSGPLVASNASIGNIQHLSSGIGNVFIQPLTFQPGDIIRLFNNSTSQITITQNTGVLIYYPNTTNSLVQAVTGNRFIAPSGYVTLTTVAANTFVISGMGFT